MIRSIPALAATSFFLLYGCSGGASEREAPSTEATASPRPIPTATPQLPDTTAEAVWALLQTEDYRSTYTLWPGMGEYYTGNEPHGMLLTTYLNDLALDALTNAAGEMPVGAILVKENFMPDSTLAATTVMVKRERSYNPDHNGWWWLKRLADGTNEVVGRGAGCQSCHAGQGVGNDYVVTGSLSGMN